MSHWKTVLRWLVLWSQLIDIILGQNDPCRPVFGYENFFQIPESTPVGSVVLTLNTSGSADTLNLTLADNGSFGFNASTQAVYVLKELDADAGQQSVKLTFTCVELAAGGSRPVTISVTISFRDVNDNPPLFIQNQYLLRIGETTNVGQMIRTDISVTDSDNQFINKATFYSVLDGPYSDYFRFVSSPDDSTVELLKALDFETLSNMTLTIAASNAMSDIKLNSTALLTILVVDEDDLNPVFTSPLYEAQVAHNVPLNSVVNIAPPIAAYDADLTLNVSVVYSFHEAQGSQKAFAIDNRTAEVRLISNVQPTKISIVLQATQTDNPSRYGVAMLVLTVLGENSNAPTFLRESYQVYASEATPVGTTILLVSAVDQDLGSTIRYALSASNSQFAVNESTGAVSLTQSLDYETSISHFFTVVASDGNLNATARVTVQVVDANDNAPSVDQQQQTVQADRQRGAVVTSIQASDADAGSQLVFKLLNYNTFFSVDNGTVRIKAEPSQLIETTYVLLITVSDNGAPPRETSVWVTVQFPPLLVTQATVMAGPGDDSAAIALGVIAAVLLVLVILLLVYICRRRSHSTEQLDKAKAHHSQDPRGLRFKGNMARSRGPDHGLDLPDDASDGATTVQDNPLKEAGAFNYAFVHHGDQERDRNMDEIHIETAVIPYGSNSSNNNNSSNSGRGHGGVPLYHNDDSSDYGDTLPHDKRSPLLNSLYPPTDTSTESLNTDLSHHSLGDATHHPYNNLTNGIASPFPGVSIGKTSFGIVGDSAEDGLDPDVSVTPALEQKSELTVYF